MKSQSLPPAIDYSAHPAFKALLAEAAPGRAEDDSNAVRNADELIEKFLRAEHTSAKSVNESFLAGPAQAIDALRDSCLGRLRDPKTKEWVAHAFEKSKAQFLEEAVFGLRQKQYRPRGEASKFERHVSELREQGFSEFSLSAGDRAAMQAGFGPHIAKLREKAASDPNGRASLPLANIGPWGRALRDVLGKACVLEAASGYRKCPMELHYISLELAHGGQGWYKGCYQDLGLPTSQTAYMHYDYEVTMVKAMVYLSDNVTDKDGPFSLIPGSNRWESSRLAYTMFRNLDLGFAELFDPSYKSSYYRPRFFGEEERRRFLSLPRWLQGTSHFGDDVLDGTELSNELLSRERKFTGSEPRCVLFDGSRVIHRGSLAQPGGERIALQLAFQPRDPASLPVRALKEARRILGRARRGQPLF